MSNEDNFKNKLEIVNLALSEIGQPSMSTWDEDPARANSVQGYCIRIFDFCKAFTIESGLWACCVKREDLKLTNIIPDGKWRFEYQLPNDYIRPVSLNEYNHFGGFRDKFLEEGDKILCNFPEAKLRYTFNLTSLSRVPPSFVRALSYAIAAQACVFKRLDDSRRQELVQLFNLYSSESVRKYRRDFMSGKSKDYGALNPWVPFTTLETALLESESEHTMKHLKRYGLNQWPGH